MEKDKMKKILRQNEKNTIQMFFPRDLDLFFY